MCIYIQDWVASSNLEWDKANHLFPIFQWLPGYGFDLFRSDLVSGLTIASLAIPQITIFPSPWCRKLGHGNWLLGPRYFTVGHLNLQHYQVVGASYFLGSFFPFKYRLLQLVQSVLQNLHCFYNKFDHFCIVSFMAGDQLCKTCKLATQNWTM